MARYPRVFGSPAARAQSRAAFSAAGGFFPALGAALGEVVESNLVTLSNIGAAVPLTIGGGSYSKNGGSYSTAATTVSDGDTIKVRVTAPSSNSATATATISINGTARSFSVTTVEPVTVTPTPTPAPTPAPTPPLTLANATPTVAENVIPGTLISNINNVPSGVTPTVTPNDGRLIIAGDAASGWKVVRGMTAASPGNLAFSVAAVGATGVNGVLTITATAFPAYTSAARQMAYGTSLPHDVIGMKSTQRRQMLTRKRLTLVGNAPSLYGTFDNVYIGAGGEVPNSAALTILQHAYILADGSASKIVTFDNGASTTKVLAAGAIKVAHDPITPADLGLSTFVGKDIICQTQVEVSNAETDANLIMNAQLTADDYGATFPAETAVITAPGIGVPVAQTGQVVVNALGGYTVSAIIGVHNGEALGQDGDSISWGTGDLTYVTNRMTGMSRSGLNASDEKPVSVLRMGRPGTTAGGRMSATGGAMRRAYMPHINHYRENFAANDLSTAPAAGMNVTVYNIKESLWAEAYDLMGASGRVTCVVPIPRTTNNTTNTPQPGWGLGGEADLLRQKILAAWASGKIHSVVTANALRLSSDPASPDYWLFKNVNMVTSDGTHLSTIGYMAFLPELRANTVRYAANDNTVFVAGVVANDNFDDATAVSVVSRPTASGHSWAPLAGSTAVLTTTGAGKAFQNPAGGMKLSAPLSPRQFAELDVVVVGFSNAEQGVFLRDHPTQNSRYYMNYAPGTGLAKIIATINGTGTIIASVALSDPGAAFTLRGEADGPNLRILVGGVEVLAVANGSLSNGKAGLSSGAASTSTTGRQFDAFRAGNLA